MASKLKHLNEKHKAACRLKVEGRGNDYICEQLGVKDETLRRWFSDEVVKKYLDDIAVQVEINFTEKMASVGAEALDQLLEMMKKPAADASITDYTRLEIIREALNRIPQTALNHERNRQPTLPGDTNNTLVFANMPTDKLAEFLHGGWRDLVPGDSANGAVK